MSSKPRKVGRPKKETDLEAHEIEHLTSLDLDFVDLDFNLDDEDLGDELEKEERVGEKRTVKLSKILPKPVLKSTPSSSRKADKT